jgi:hypothetical protein
MVAWYWVIVAILITNAITSFTYEFFEWDNLWVDFIGLLALIILYVPLSLYHIFLKNTIHAITPIRFEKLMTSWKNDRRMKVFSLPYGFYFCVDPMALKLWNKIFFLRVKK